MAGYFIGDGSVTDNNAAIDCADDVEGDDLVACAEKMGWSVRVRARPWPHKAMRYTFSNGVRPWLRAADIAGRSSHTKRVPEWVFTAPAEMVAEFIGAYLACDGSVSKSAHTIVFDSMARDLLADVQSLLIRFGIRASLRAKNQTNNVYSGGPVKSWVLTITSADDFARFTETIRTRSIKADRMIGRALRQSFNAEILADPVASIDPAGTAHCRCLTVDEDSSFTVNGVAVHNSTTLRLGIIWALDYDPTLPIIYATYGQDLAREGAVFARDIADAHQDELRFQLRRDVKRADRWMTDAGGGLLARSLSAGISGYPAGLALIDDPLKNWQEAHRPLAREQVWGHITGVVRLRLRQGGGVIVAHARLHEDDPAGRLRRLAAAEGIELEVISLPMLAEPESDEYGPDPLGRAVGEPLEPRRYDLAEAKSRAVFLGGYLSSAIEQQRPQPETGGEILREWWKWTATPPNVFTDVMSSWDMKLKDRETGDYVVGVVGGRVGGDFWIVDMLRGQYSQLQTKIAIALTSIRHPYVRTHLIENSGNGPEVMAELRRGDPTFTLSAEQADKVGVGEHDRDAVQAVIRDGLSGLIAVNVKGSKLVRARAVVPYIEAGNVHLIENKSWAHALVDEHAAFPPKTGGHDDIVDAVSQLLSRLAKGKAVVKPAPTSAVTPPAPGQRATSGAARILNR